MMPLSIDNRGRNKECAGHGSCETLFKTNIILLKWSKQVSSKLRRFEISSSLMNILPGHWMFYNIND